MGVAEEGTDSKKKGAGGSLSIQVAGAPRPHCHLDESTLAPSVSFWAHPDQDSEKEKESLGHIFTHGAVV